MTTIPSMILRQYYHPKCEVAINNQISLELYAAYAFETMASYFNSQEGTLKKFVDFFLLQSCQEMEYAQELMGLQNRRGGRLNLLETYNPNPGRWENGIKVMECAFHLKMSLNQGLINLHQLAVEMADANLSEFLKMDHLCEQMKITKELKGYITHLRQLEAEELSLAEELCAKLTLGESKKI